MRIGYIDIEIDSINGFPDVNKASNPLTMFSVYDNKLDRTITLGLKPNSHVSTSIENCVLFDKEIDLLKAIIHLFEKCRWQIITGWYSESFDIPFLINRMMVVLKDDSYKRLSPIGDIQKDHKGHYKIAGVSHLDSLQLYKKFEINSRESYQLDNILKLELGKEEGKVVFEGSLTDLYRKDFEKYIEYNRQDVRGLVKLESKKKFIDLTQQITGLSCCELEDIYYNTRLVDGLILANLKPKNLVAPDKSNEEGEDNGYSGAFVLDPIKGLHEWVISLDLTSLYPSIIRSLNMSPETIQEENSNTNGLSDDYFISPNNYKFTKKYRGVIPQITDELFEKRLNYKKLMNEAKRKNNEELYSFYWLRQYVIKIFLNSIYGYLGSKTTRFYDRRIAEAVTTIGQEILKYSIGFFNAKDNIQIVAGDTDSVYINLSKICKSKDDCIKIGRMLQDEINNSLTQFAKDKFNIKDDEKHYFEFKFEKICRRLIAIAKKRYAYLLEWSEGFDSNEVGVVGIEVVRSDTPMVCRDFMKTVLHFILDGKSKNEVDEYITLFTNSYRNMSYEDKSIPVGVHGVRKYTDKKTGNPIKGASAHIKAAINYNRLIQPFHTNLAPIRDEDKIRYFFVKNSKVDVIGYIDFLPELKQFEIDDEHMIQRLITHKIESVYDCLGWKMIFDGSQVNDDLFN